MSTIHMVIKLSQNYVLLDQLLLKLITVPDKEKALLAIPESCTDKIILLYHDSLFAGHQGVIRTYLTMSRKFFIPNLMHYLRAFLKACHICQLSRNDKPPSRQLETRINLKLQTHVQTEHGSEGYAQMTETTLVYFMCHRQGH